MREEREKEGERRGSVKEEKRERKQRREEKARKEKKERKYILRCWCEDRVLERRTDHGKGQAWGPEEEEEQVKFRVGPLLLQLEDHVQLWGERRRRKVESLRRKKKKERRKKEKEKGKERERVRKRK